MNSTKFPWYQLETAINYFYAGQDADITVESYKNYMAENAGKTNLGDEILNAFKESGHIEINEGKIILNKKFIKFYKEKIINK